MLLGGCHVYDWMGSIQITVHGMEGVGKEGMGSNSLTFQSLETREHKFRLCF